jgi:8-oxo-dGTP diphosphatase
MRPSSRRGERSWLAEYDPRAFPAFVVTVDLAIFTIRDGVLCVLLVKRGSHPCRGWWALPGGHIRQSVESAEAAAARELEEETGLDRLALGAHLEQLATYSEPWRDPRMKVGLQVVTVAFVALVPNLGAPRAGTDASAAQWWPVEDLTLVRGRGAERTANGQNPEGLALAFDHATILSDALERVRSKLEYTTLAAQFLSEPFSLADLRRVYLAVWGAAPDLANFRRKVLSTPGFVEPAERSAASNRTAPGRPPLLYRRGPATYLDPPLRRVG